MIVENINPITDPRWQELVEQYEGDVFHSPEWMRVIRDTYDFNIRARVALDGLGVPRAGLAYCQIDDMMDARIVSLPFSDFCDPLVAGMNDWHMLINDLVEQEKRITLRCLHNEAPLADKRFTLTNRAKWHCVDLQREKEDLWTSLHSSARRAIRKAERSGVSVKIAQNKEDLRAFFELHLNLRKYKYQLLAQPYCFFEYIWDYLIDRGHGVLKLAVYEDQVIGGVMFLESQNKLYYKFNASDPDYIYLRPNDLVVWKGIQYGQARGRQYLDFGLSDWDQEGLLRYKRKFATSEKTIFLLRFTPAGSPTRKEKQLRQLLPQLTDLFVDESVPDFVTEKAGDALYRYFT